MNYISAKTSRDIILAIIIHWKSMFYADNNRIAHILLYDHFLAAAMEYTNKYHPEISNDLMVIAIDNRLYKTANTYIFAIYSPQLTCKMMKIDKQYYLTQISEGLIHCLNTGRYTYTEYRVRIADLCRYIQLCSCITK